MWWIDALSSTTIELGLIPLNGISVGNKQRLMSHTLKKNLSIDTSLSYIHGCVHTFAVRVQSVCIVHTADSCTRHSKRLYKCSH